MPGHHSSHHHQQQHRSDIHHQSRSSRHHNPTSDHHISRPSQSSRQSAPVHFGVGLFNPRSSSSAAHHRSSAGHNVPSSSIRHGHGDRHSGASSHHHSYAHRGTELSLEPPPPPRHSRGHDSSHPREHYSGGNEASHRVRFAQSRHPAPPPPLPRGREANRHGGQDPYTAPSHRDYYTSPPRPPAPPNSRETSVNPRSGDGAGGVAGGGHGPPPTGRGRREGEVQLPYEIEEM